MTSFDDHKKEFIAKSQAEKARAEIDTSENQEEQDYDDDDFDHCPYCDGTGEGRHEGQICPACKGKGY